MFFILLIFILQFLGLKILVGSLTSSVIFYKINLIDPFAFLEVSIATRSVTVILLLSLIPVIVIYLVFGRAFCGWVCPFDFIFKLIGKLSPHSKRETRLIRGNGFGNVKSGINKWLLVVAFIVLALIIKVPIFTRYISHNTNLFRAMSSLSGIIKSMSYALDEFLFSISMIILLVAFEYFFPRKWCRSFCPVGKIYGLFNKISLIKLKFENSEMCKECFVCQIKCYMGVPLHEFILKSKERNGKVSGRFIDCIYCGECVLACEKIQEGVSSIKISLK
ncbi:ferredoxin-type protein NapH [Candidatus Kryptonium thompsonii]|nr:ferredoxin-type protein NapH [Candidatus Kryptonium thompsoni]CUT07436.1 ferredoxin-type protein NapH [Candidatus Kryptonium thompsoni]